MVARKFQDSVLVACKMFKNIVLILLLFVLYTSPIFSITLTGGQLTVVFDDLFPRPLSYSTTRTDDIFKGALNDWNFHLSLSLNAGQAICGEKSITTVYTILPMPPNEAGVDFSVTCACLLNFDDNDTKEKVVNSHTSIPTPSIVYVELNGTVIIRADNSLPIPGADIFEWILTSTSVLEGSASMDVNYALDKDEVDRGYILTCQAHPTSDKLVVSFDD